MNSVIEKALFHLTHNGNIAEVNVDELKNMAAAHPYFAPAQFLLAAKMKSEDNYLQDAQLQKASLYFNNFNWLQHQLNGDESTSENIFAPAKQAIKTAKIELSVPSNEKDIVKEEFWKEEPVQDQTTVTPHEASDFSYTPEMVIPTVEHVKEILHNIDHPSVQNNHIPETYPETIQEPVLKINPTEFKTTLPTYSDAFKSIPTGTKEEASSPTIDRYELTGDSFQEKKLSDLLSTQLSESNKPVDKDAKLDLEMEPYYTIDYFASQGIKADLTQQPQDKLTQQLLKFTDWLKKMKNVNPNPQDLGTDPELENAIHGIANASNESREIVTETMAEVFVKQGKVDKAVQLFIKLSFLEPEKSAYFAAKIQQLKGL